MSNQNKQRNNGVTVIDSTSAILDIETTQAFVNITDVKDLGDLIESITDDQPDSVTQIDGYRGYVSWGSDNQRPYKVIEAVGGDEVLAQNKLFNAMTCYSSGLRIARKNNESITNKDILDFFKYNRPAKYLLEQAVDIKYFFFTVTVIIVSNDGSKIVKMRHKEACNCRFETCNPKTGKIEHLFYGDFKDKQPKREELEVIPVLDYYDPLGDLEEQFGRKPNDEGKIRSSNQITRHRKFAIINRVAVVNDKYYPVPPSWSIFNSGWYEYSRLIPYKKIQKIKSSTSIKYHVEIHRDYFKGLWDEEGITDPIKQKERQKKEYENIKNFVTGIENSGKLWISGYYTHPQTGKEVGMIKITKIDTSKEGGELIEDSAEANNMKCYVDGVHSALIGANPGKSSGNFSGSVQRELFTIKQALEKPYHDVLLEPYFVVKEFNKWDDLIFDIPVITLTTLDKGKDAEENTLREPNNQ